jgi:hypothetical protein
VLLIFPFFFLVFYFCLAVVLSISAVLILQSSVGGFLFHWRENVDLLTLCLVLYSYSFVFVFWLPVVLVVMMFVLVSCSFRLLLDSLWLCLFLLLLSLLPMVMMVMFLLWRFFCYRHHRLLIQNNGLGHNGLSQSYFALRLISIHIRQNLYCISLFPFFLLSNVLVFLLNMLGKILILLVFFFLFVKFFVNFLGGFFSRLFLFEFFFFFLVFFKVRFHLCA